MARPPEGIISDIPPLCCNDDAIRVKFQSSTRMFQYIQYVATHCNLKCISRRVFLIIKDPETHCTSDLILVPVIIDGSDA